MAPPKGKTNNPNGRPPKRASLTNMLENALKRGVDIGTNKKAAGKRVLADLIVQAATRGRVRFPKDTEDSVLSLPDWMTIAKWLYERVDGRPAQMLNEFEIAEIEAKFAPPPESQMILSALQIAPSFFNVYRDIMDHRHTEYVMKGGRGSTKSSFVSLIWIALIVNNPEWHGLVLRQVAATIRDSVFSQLIWAINYLDLESKFKTTVNPLEITYIPTDQKIYFRGGDDPMKIKSIKPKQGYINMVWFEELDQFHGENSIRSIQQSALRGGDRAFIFKSFNPPRSINNWVHKSLQIPKENRYVHESNYLSVPVEWLGQAFIDEASYLGEVNPDAYDHEYLGIANSAGGMVFENVEIRDITDAEIYGAPDPATGLVTGGFDRIFYGLDWGYYPDPAHYSVCHFDASRRTLYIYGEFRGWKLGNEELYAAIKKAGYPDQEILTCDSAEPKSIADFRSYGASARGAEKGAESVDYSMKWLQSLRKIIIDNKRCPHAAEEFLGYEYERTKDDEIISAYPDENNHAIDSVRYATNRFWIRRGQ